MISNLVFNSLCLTYLLGTPAKLKKNWDQVMTLQAKAESSLADIKKITPAQTSSIPAGSQKLGELEQQYNGVINTINSLFASLHIKDREEMQSYQGT